MIKIKFNGILFAAIVALALIGLIGKLNLMPEPSATQKVGSTSENIEKD
jgi:hypothetical protein